MTNLRINFSNPWLLLLLIPAVALTLFSYFRLNKRYRFTRNHIVSIVLHLVVMVLAITLLAGIVFGYSLPNNDNEIILLVDASYSTSSDSQDEVDDFIRDVIAESDSMFELGIVTFGYDQVYAAELTNRTDSLYSDYLQAELPNTSATDIAAALNYAATLFKNPESAKIVLISDAVETDGNANGVIKAIAAQGIMVDTVHFPGEELETEVQIVSAATPADKILVGEKFNFELTIQSSYRGTATITPYDNNTAGQSITVELSGGVQNVVIPYAFAFPGMHQMSFEIEAEDDTMVQNNSYLSYVYLEIYDKILILESIDDESLKLRDMLKDELNVTVINVEDVEAMPKTLDDLRAYDEVILCNVSNSDMPEGLIENLYTYVHDIGGGLFTICGNKPDSNPNDEEWTANAYTREDMYNTLYQQMLPVEVIEYTPPVAVMIIIDTSGSMYYAGNENYETSKLFYAQQGAEACLDALTERDYVGIMTLGNSYTEEIELTPRTQREKILSAIDLIDDDESNLNGGTIFSASLERAGKALSALSQVERRHIIIVTDGEPSGGDEYEYWMEENAKLGITMSIVGIQCTASAQALMENVLVKHAGMKKENFHNVNDIASTPEVMREDLQVPEIKDVNFTPFVPQIKGYTSVTNGILQEDMPELDGFFGLKLKKDATAILMGDYTPIYAQWQFGKGRVGTFACDLNGVWSANFVGTDTATTLINNIVTALFPSESVRATDIDAQVTGKNYTNQLSVFTDLNEGETIVVTITSPAVDGEPAKVQTLSAGAGEGYSRFTFAVTTPGMHEIVIQKKNAEGVVLSSHTLYKLLSYSQEYNAFYDRDAALALAELIAANGNGDVLNEAIEVFDDATKYLERTIDPRIAFLIIIIALFLLDIAVRKFKWKWPHEIIRDKKTHKGMSQKR
jgi:Mg-chelatase subunit ChlD